jgi:hypothetical protein
LSELPFKRRLREWERRIMADLANKGYKVRRFDDGPFHLLACRGKTGRAIRISFGLVHYDENAMVMREPVPARCIREVWKISDNGASVSVIKIEKSVNGGNPRTISGSVS